jgi:serine/threonine protein kinase
MGNTTKEIKKPVNEDNSKIIIMKLFQEIVMTSYMLLEKEVSVKYNTYIIQVWKVLYKKNKKFYALKEMSKAKIVEKKSQNSVRYERELLSKIRHP